MTFSARAIERKILEIVRARGEDKTACPSEIARALDETDWRKLMPAVRRAAGRLAAAGRIEILQRGARATATTPGPIRLRVVGPKGLRRVRLKR